MAAPRRPQPGVPKPSLGVIIFVGLLPLPFLLWRHIRNALIGYTRLKLANPERSLHFKITREQIILHTPYETHAWRWDVVTKVVETPIGFLFYFWVGGLWLPAHAFEPADERGRLRRMAATIVTNFETLESPRRAWARMASKKTLDEILDSTP